MKILTTIICFILSAFAALAQTAQPAPVATIDEAGICHFEWETVQGRTYFIKVSTDLENFMFLPEIISGDGSVECYCFQPQDEQLFLVIQYTDQATSNPALADFDNDGFTNQYELQVGTSPFEFNEGGGPPDPGGGGAGGGGGGQSGSLPEFTLRIELDYPQEAGEEDRDETINVFMNHDFKILNINGENTENQELSLPPGEEDLEIRLKLMTSSNLSTAYTLEFLEYRKWGTSAGVEEKIKIVQPLIIGPGGGNGASIESNVVKITEIVPGTDRERVFFVGGIIPDTGQVGVTGDQIQSDKWGSREKHYVSPKKTPEIPLDYVVLTARGIDNARFTKLLQWDGGEEVPNEANKIRVSRANSKKERIALKIKDGGDEVAVMTVWIVWAEATQVTPGVLEPLNSANLVQIKADNRWKFVYTISPASIITDQEKPMLRRTPRTPVPGAGKPFSTNPSVGDGDNGGKRWDLSRKIEIRVNNGMGIPAVDLDNLWPTAWVNGQPANQTVPVQFPQDPVEGNDDPVGGDENGVPYNQIITEHLAHGVGEVSSFDFPSAGANVSWGIEHAEDGQELELIQNFREFSRLELWDGLREVQNNTWFRISGYTDWHFSMKIKYIESSNSYIDNGSSTGLGHKN